MKCLLTIGLITLWNFASAQVLLWDNGDADFSSNYSSERDTKVSGIESWVVDDAVFTSPVLVEAFRWDSILRPRHFKPAAVDIIILSTSFEKLFEFSDLRYSRHQIGIDRGLPVYAMRTDDFTVSLPAGRYYFGGRIVGGGAGRGFAELRTNDPRGVTNGYFRAAFFGFPEWTPLAKIFGGATKELAFKVYGEVVPEPGALIGLLFGVAFCAIRRARTR